MTPDQISKLPPESQIWAKMLNRLHDEGSLNVDQERLYAALTWGLQVVEERDRAIAAQRECQEQRNQYAILFGPLDKEWNDVQWVRNQLVLANEHTQTAEATIATLTRLCELQDQLLICYRLQTRPTEGLLTGIRKAKAALSHTPEGGGK